MPIINNVVFDDSVPQDVVNVLLWAEENKTRVKITWDDGFSSKGLVRFVGDSLKAPYLQVLATEDLSTKDPMLLDGIVRIETSDRSKGGLLWDGIPMTAALATSIAVAQAKKELDA